MAIKAARDSFQKDDIIEILKRNVALYKDEKEFVDYIVNLAMYLMDQYYGSERGEYDSNDPGLDLQQIDLPEELPVDFSMSDIKGPAPVKPPPARDVPAPGAANDLPPTAEERARRQAERDRRTIPRFETTAKVPGTDAFDLGPAMPPSPRDALSENKAKAEQQRIQEEEDKKKVIEVERSPLVTPTRDVTKEPKRGVEKKKGAEDDEGPTYQRSPLSDDEKEGPHVDIRNQGRTRVYRVVRPYKSGTGIEQPCPICGAMVPLGEKQCQGCGHIM